MRRSLMLVTVVALVLGVAVPARWVLAQQFDAQGRIIGGGGAPAAAPMVSGAGAAGSSPRWTHRAT